jgi:hypothetical protein
MMRRFKWIEWNVQKIAAHPLSAEEVEAAFDRVYQVDERRDDSFELIAEIPSGRRIRVIWQIQPRRRCHSGCVRPARGPADFCHHGLLRGRVMPAPEPDQRSDRRKHLDQQIAAEPPRPLADLPADTRPRPMEEHLRKRRQPVAVVGIVENGLVRPLDPDARLPERARVIIVSSETR